MSQYNLVVQWSGKDSLADNNPDKVVSGDQLHWFPSVVDLRVHHTLPGGEHKEDWNSLQEWQPARPFDALAIVHKRRK